MLVLYCYHQIVMYICTQDHWIDKEKLIQFILECQDTGVPDGTVVEPDPNIVDMNVTNGGGIAERPGNMADIFHTFFGIAGLSLLGYFEHAMGVVKYDFKPNSYSLIDPTFALPVPILAAMNVKCETRTDPVPIPLPSVGDNHAEKLMQLFASLNIGTIIK